MSAADGSPCGAAMAGLNHLLESETLAHLTPAATKQAWSTAAAAVTHLRTRLTEICEAGDQACTAVAASALPDAAKLEQLNAIKVNVNGDAAGASRAAVAKIVSVVQELIDLADSGNDATEWLAAQGFHVAEPPPPPPITKDKLR